MVRRVVSLVRGAPLALHGTDPVLEANAYAVAEAVELTVVLAGPAVELAVAGGEAPVDAGIITDGHGGAAGPSQPPAPRDQDLRGLLESGVAVYVGAEDVRRLGLEPDDLVAGIQVVDAATIAAVLRGGDAILAW